MQAVTWLVAHVRLFWDFWEGKERRDPYISLDRYDIGGTGEADHTVYLIEEEDPKLVKRCEEYGDIIRQQGIRLYTQEEVDGLIGKQKEKLGLHDLWMEAEAGMAYSSGGKIRYLCGHGYRGGNEMVPQVFFGMAPKTAQKSVI